MTNRTILLDGRQWWLLAEIAESRGVTIAELLIGAVDSFMPEPDDPVVALWREGKPDRVIAGELGMTNRAVAERRRRAGLPARDGSRKAS